MYIQVLPVIAVVTVTTLPRLAPNIDVGMIFSIHKPVATSWMINYVYYFISWRFGNATDVGKLYPLGAS